MTVNDKIKQAVFSMASMPLFLEKQGAANLLMRYNSVVNSGVLNSETLIEKHQKKMEELTSVSFYSAEKNVVTGKFGADFGSVPKNSIAVIPVMGVMMRDSYCTLSDGYISGTRDLERTIEQLEGNSNIDGIVFYIDTPGGQAKGNESLAKKITKCSKPTVGIFEMMASAGVAAFQGVDELYAVDSDSSWGSIGTYITLMDDRKFWEEMGVNFVEIYAPQSTEKNKPYREAMNGNKEPMLNWLEEMTSSFIKSVKKATPSIKDDGLVFKGKLYNAVQAKKIGAITGIKDLNFAIERARYLSRNGKGKKKTAVKNQTEMSEEKQSFWNKMFGSATAKEAEEKVEATSKEMNDLKQKVEGLEKDSTDKQTQLDQLTSSNEDLQKQLDEANAKNKALSENIAALEGTEFDTVQALVDDHKKVVEHNKELGAAQAAATPSSTEENTSTAVHQASVAKARTARDIIDQVQQEKESKSKK